MYMDIYTYRSQITMLFTDSNTVLYVNCISVKLEGDEKL